MDSASTGNNTASRASYVPRPLRDLSPGELFFYIAVVFMGLLLRWLDLDYRAVFHDESLHAQYGKYFWDAPDQNYYQYNPMLHGPMIYNLYRLIYAIFGATTWASRFPMCVLGTIFMLLPLLYRRYLSKNAFLFLSTAIAISPTLIYWSRFARGDYYVITGLLLMLHGVFVAKDRLKGFYVFLGLTVQFCVKENSYVHVAILLGYLFYEWLFCWLKSDHPRWLVVSAARMLANVAFLVVLTIALRKYGFEPANAWFVTLVGLFAYEALFGVALPAASFEQIERPSKLRRPIAFAAIALIAWVISSVPHVEAPTYSEPKTVEEREAVKKPSAYVIANAQAGASALAAFLFLAFALDWLLSLERTRSRLFLALFFMKASAVALIGLALNLLNVHYLKLETGLVYVSMLLVLLWLEIAFNLKSLEDRRFHLASIFYSPPIFVVLFGLGLALQLFGLRYLGVGGSFLSIVDIQIYLVLALAIVGASALFNRLALDESAEPSLAARMCRYIAAYRYELIAGTIPAICMFVYLYTAGFRHQKGIIDALYRESLGYWWHHHSIERIKGPFLFHFYVFSFYEILFVLAFLAHLVIVYSKNGRVMKTIGSVTILALLAIGLYHLDAKIVIEEAKVWKIFKLKDFLDVIGLVVIAVHSITITTFHLLRGEKTLALWAYLFMAMFGTYNYLGEKVPWLSSYALIPGLIYLTLFFSDYLSRRQVDYGRYPFFKILAWLGATSMLLGIVFVLEEAIPGGKALEWVRSIYSGNVDQAKEFRTLIRDNAGFLAAGLLLVLFAILDRKLEMVGFVNLRNTALAVLLLYNSRSAILTNFVFPGDAREYIGQVHTTPEFDAIALRIRHEVLSSLDGQRPDVCVDGDAVWPMTWYMRDLNEYRFGQTGNERLKCTYIITDWKENATDLPPGFSVRRITLRGWFVPDFRNVTLKKFLRYTLNHANWNEVGYTYAYLLKNMNKP